MGIISGEFKFLARLARAKRLCEQLIRKVAYCALPKLLKLFTCHRLISISYVPNI